MSTDHSPIFCSFSKNPETPIGNGLWNSTILYAKILITLQSFETMDNHLKLIQKIILKGNISAGQMISQYLKYEIRKFSISFSK